MINRKQLQEARERRAKELGITVEERAKQLMDRMDELAITRSEVNAPYFYRDCLKGTDHCGICSALAVTHKVCTDGFFVGAAMHCTEWTCPQSYNFERNQYRAKIKELEDRLSLK